MKEGNKYVGKFLHEAIVTVNNLYPCDISSKEVLSETLKTAIHFKGIHDISSNSVTCQKLLENLFWLFFCVKFQRNTFGKVGVSLGCESSRKVIK